MCVWKWGEDEERKKQKKQKKTWHTRNIPSSPQEINLFERAARLKIGKPQTIELELIAQIL